MHMARNVDSITKPVLLNRWGVRILVICFWLLFWELLYRLIDNEIFIASPIAVIRALWQLIGQAYFWQAIAFSFIRIVLGFILAVILGTTLAILSYQSFMIKELLCPLFKVIKATPVASFVILALLWMKAGNLSILISFLMVVPMMYTNVLQGLLATDRKLLEMAKVFRLGRWKKVKAIYLPAVMPYFYAAISVGLGFCWKAGIAAEVIGIPSGSIGEWLYEAKIYLMTSELFAWTIVIILISILFENVVIHMLKPFRFQTEDDKSKHLGNN